MGNQSFELNVTITVKTIKSIKPHSSCINSIIRLADNRIATCSSDKSIKIYDSKFKVQINILDNISDVISMAQIDNGNIVSITNKNVLMQFELSKDSYKQIYSIEQEPLYDLPKICSLSENRFEIQYQSLIAVMKGADKEPIKLFMNREYELTSMLYIRDKEILICVSNETTYMFNMSNYQQINVSKQNVLCTAGNSIIQISKEILLVGGYNKITKLNFYTNKIIEKGYKGYVYSFMKMKFGKVLCGCDNGRFGVYNEKSNDLVLLATEKKVNITNLLSIDDSSFIMGAPDGSISIYSY